MTLFAAQLKLASCSARLERVCFILADALAVAAVLVEDVTRVLQAEPTPEAVAMAGNLWTLQQTSVGSQYLHCPA